MDVRIINELLSNFEVIDLSHTLEEGIPTFPRPTPYSHSLFESYWHGDTAASYEILMNEHTGTHMDTPAHFMRPGHPAHVWVDELPATCLIGRGVMIDVSDTPPKTTFGLSVLKEFEQQQGPIEEGDIVLFRTGWDRKWKLNPEFGPFLHDWPGPSREVAEALVQRRVKAVGIDVTALDAYGNPELPCHNILLGNRIPLIENVANLYQLPPFSIFIATPLKIKGGSGSPLRPLAFVPKAAV